MNLEEAKAKYRKKSLKHLVELRLYHSSVHSAIDPVIFEKIEEAEKLKRGKNAE